MKKYSQKLLNIIKKIALTLATFFGIILLILALFGRSSHVLELVFLDVGQGDGTLIKTPSGQVILIDGGPDNIILQGLGKNLPFYRKRIDFIILSHYHDDHAVGLIEIIKRYRVGTLIFQDKLQDSLIIDNLMKIATQSKVELKPLAGQADLSFGTGCNLSLLNPVILGVKEDSNNSIVSRLDCKNLSVLLAGDNPETTEKILINSNWPLKADIFKASHHGSNTSNSTAFLKRVAPRLIVVSVGADNRFGHPGTFFIERAATLGIPVKRTDIDGELKYITE